MNGRRGKAPSTQRTAEAAFAASFGPILDRFETALVAQRRIQAGHTNSLRELTATAKGLAEVAIADGGLVDTVQGLRERQQAIADRLSELEVFFARFDGVIGDFNSRLEALAKQHVRGVKGHLLWLAARRTGFIEVCSAGQDDQILLQGWATELPAGRIRVIAVSEPPVLAELSSATYERDELAGRAKGFVGILRPALIGDPRSLTRFLYRGDDGWRAVDIYNQCKMISARRDGVSSSASWSSFWLKSHTSGRTTSMGEDQLRATYSTILKRSNGGSKASRVAQLPTIQTLTVIELNISKQDNHTGRPPVDAL